LESFLQEAETGTGERMQLESVDVFDSCRTLGVWIGFGEFRCDEIAPGAVVPRQWARRRTVI
jgi:hypothetical protein